MNNRFCLHVGHFLVVMFALVVCNACNSDSRKSILTERLGEINFLIERSQGSIAQIPEGVRIKLSREAIEKFPENRLELEEAARAAMPYYDNDIKRFEQIANKYDEIENLNISSDASRSAHRQKIKFEKYREMVEKQKARVGLILDPLILDKSQLYEKTSALEIEIRSLETEIKFLEETDGTSF